MKRLAFLVSAVVFFCAASSAQEMNGTLKRIADSGEMKIGFVPDAPPMSYLDDDGNAVGYSITLCKTVA